MTLSSLKEKFYVRLLNKPKSDLKQITEYPNLGPSALMLKFE